MPSPQSGTVLEVPQKRSHLTADGELSRRASEYLHNHRLPYVNAQVVVDDAGVAKSVALTGQVRTDFGKQDAERKARDFLRDTNLRFDNQIQVKSQLASGEVTPKGQSGELMLPQVFQGCWDLVSDHEIGQVQLMPTAREGCVYTPNTGRFCYERRPDGSLEPTMSSFRIVAGYSGLQNQWSRLEVISTDGQTRAGMRFQLHHADVGGLRLFSLGTKSIDERHMFDCDVQGGLMSCIDQEYAVMYGQPWCNAPIATSSAVCRHNGSVHTVPPRSAVWRSRSAIFGICPSAAGDAGERDSPPSVD